MLPATGFVGRVVWGCDIWTRSESLVS